ncbi:MAG: bifunctional enoyl-CoA hydratase/phosphate acetyltransferase [Clostridiaceae bacterium]
MIINDFNQLIKNLKTKKIVKKVAVVSAEDSHTLESIIKAKNEGFIAPILIGDKVKIENILINLGENKSNYEILNSCNDSISSYKACELVNKNKADFIMKGKIQTSTLLKAVVDKENGIRTGRLMSHIAILEVPTYHKLLAITDGGMFMYPNLNEKKQIILNAVNCFNNLGYENPKIAILAAVENVNPKMIETQDADLLKKMNLNGDIKNCIIEGPISYDLAMSKESANIKGYNSQVTGDADILIVPNITAGNLLSKSLIYSANAKMAGFIVGAKVPIVLTSRGSSSAEKYLSLVISASNS